MKCVGALAAATLLTFACRDRVTVEVTTPVERDEPDRSLVIVLGDTLRQDRVGAYGGPASTPAFDRFAADNILLRRVYSQAPWTKPSVATMFTSTFPSQHGLLSHPSSAKDPEGRGRETLEGDVLGEEVVTLAEALQAEGFRTAAFVGNPWMLEEFGFGQGFDHYDDSFAGWDVTGEAVAAAAGEWLAQVPAGERFFLYVHMMDCHRPYLRITPPDVRDHLPAIQADRRPLSPLAAEEIPKVVRFDDTQGRRLPPSITLTEIAYDKGVSAFDRGLGAVLAAAERRADWDRIAMVVTSDHGEALYERGWGNHGQGLYDDEVAVPMAVRFPWRRAEDLEQDRPLGLVDLYPTLCDYLEVPLRQRVFGESWFAKADEVPTSRDHLVIEGVGGKPGHRAILSGPYKLLEQPMGGPDGKRRALFDVVLDPDEQLDLLDPDRVTPEIRQLAAAMLEGGRRQVSGERLGDVRSVPMDPETRARLQHLGYLPEDDDE